MKLLDFFHRKCYFQYLMKYAKRAKELEIRAVDAIQELLGNVPSVQVGSVKYEDRLADNLRIDGRIGFSHGRARYQLIVEVKSDGAPPPCSFRGLPTQGLCGPFTSTRSNRDGRALDSDVCQPLPVSAVASDLHGS